MGKSVQLSNISKRFGRDEVLQNYNLVVPSGQFFALLGPSGCGKTTILRLIAGFEEPDAGKIFLGDEDITNVPINERRINTVFQNYALFPHLTVFENVAYSLVVRGVAKDEVAQRVMRVLTSVHMDRFAQRGIGLLSGGQQQRVALARAIINEPEVLLLDEPLAALDLKLRERMLVELMDLQEQLGTTFIYITHDQDEALAVADQMAIMNQDGQIEQLGPPDDIYEHPKSSYVAQFVGTTNILQGILQKQDEQIYLVTEGLSVAVGEKQEILQTDKPAFLSVRPEKMLISKSAPVGYENCFRGTVQAVIYHGKAISYRVSLAENSTITVFDQNRSDYVAVEFADDATVFVSWHAKDSTLLVR